MTVTSDKTRFLTTEDRGTNTWLWDIQTTQPTRTYQAQYSPFGVFARSFSPDDRRVLVTDHLVKECHIWDVESGNIITNFAGGTRPMYAVFRPLMDMVISAAVAGDDHQLRLWAVP